MKTTKPELEVPDEAVEALYIGVESLKDRVTTHNDAVRAIATPVVAAELRRLALESNDTGDAAIVRDRMRNRAHDLEAQS